MLGRLWLRMGFRSSRGEVRGLWHAAKRIGYHCFEALVQTTVASPAFQCFFCHANRAASLPSASVAPEPVAVYSGAPFTSLP